MNPARASGRSSPHELRPAAHSILTPRSPSDNEDSNRSESGSAWLGSTRAAPAAPHAPADSVAGQSAWTHVIWGWHASPQKNTKGTNPWLPSRRGSSSVRTRAGAGAQPTSRTQSPPRSSLPKRTSSRSLVANPARQRGVFEFCRAGWPARDSHTHVNSASILNTWSSEPGRSREVMASRNSPAWFITRTGTCNWRSGHSIVSTSTISSAECSHIP